MTLTLTIAPVRKSIVVRATPEHAFEVFTAQLDRWWPPGHTFGSAPVRHSVIEPQVGGRWVSTCEDGSEAVVGHVLVWEPGRRFVVTWEINAQWKSDPRPRFTSEVEVRFASVGDGTRVDLEHRHFERMGEADGQRTRGAVDGGWPGLLERFARAAAAAPADQPDPGASMPAFTLHLIPGSPFCRSALLALEEKRLPYRVANVPLASRREPPYLALHPFARVPVLEHDGFVLYETAAILRYVDRVGGAPALTPADPKAAARMDLLMNVNDWYLFQGVGNVIGFHRVVAPRVLGREPDEAACAEAMPQAHTVFAELARQLGERPYFGGQAPDLADLMLAPQLDILALAPEWQPLTAQRGALPDWLARMRSRPSMQATTWERVAAMAAA